MKKSIYLDQNARFSVSGSVFHSDVGEEKVILSLKNGAYYSLEELGAYIWNLLEKSQSLKEIRDTIVKEYEIESEECEQDLQELLQDFLNAELIEKVDE